LGTGCWGENVLGHGRREEVTGIWTENLHKKELYFILKYSRLTVLLEEAKEV
jgi:hypothetical protein